MEYGEFMRGMCNAPWDFDKCKKCGGTGYTPVMCCNGHDCGCHGMPVEFELCSCGTKVPQDEDISKWAKTG